MLTNYFPQDWINAIGEQTILTNLAGINATLAEERKLFNVLPEQGSPLLFQAFRETPFTKVKVVVLGMDPYHDGSYNGLAFGNGTPTEPSKTTGISPSLRNVLAEVKSSYDGAPHSSLYDWSYQGVLLINTAHTVVKGTAGSHIPLWSKFTSSVINAINSKDNIVWMLWGSNAHAYADSVTNPSHIVIKSGHPSPLNRSNPFIGCGCFSECDSALMKKGIIPIQWI